MNIMFRTLLCFLTVFLSGCFSKGTKFQAEPIYQYNSQLVELKGKHKGKVNMQVLSQRICEINHLAMTTFKDSTYSFSNTKDCQDVIAPAGDVEQLIVGVAPEEDKKSAQKTILEMKRNELLQELILISNKVCYAHESEIIANQIQWNIGSLSVSNLFSALGTVVSGTAAKTNYAAAAALSNSTSSLVSKELYLQQLSQTIVQAIETSREKAWAKLENRMNDSYRDYTIYQGMVDVQEYHRRCSFYYGLLEISKSLENREETTDEIEAKIRFLDNFISETGEETTQNDGQQPDSESTQEQQDQVEVVKPVDLQELNFKDILQKRNQLILKRLDTKEQ